MKLQPPRSPRKLPGPIPVYSGPIIDINWIGLMFPVIMAVATVIGIWFIIR